MSLFSPRAMPPTITTKHHDAAAMPLSPEFTYTTTASSYSRHYQHYYVLPVLWMEFLALALTRAVLPGMLLEHFGDNVYLIMGCAECCKGLLAFVSCPIFGKWSDVLGRRLCLFVTVAGTCAPVCSLALLAKLEEETIPPTTEIMNTTTDLITTSMEEPSSESSSWMFWSSSSPSTSENLLSVNAIWIFVVLFALSGIFSSTFTLVFAYISDTVQEKNERVSAYGLALATFGLSFTIGPMAGGYIAHAGHAQDVFWFSFLLTILDLLYIYFVLPESNHKTTTRTGGHAHHVDSSSWWQSPWQTLQIIAVDPFLRQVCKVAFLYYTSLWAVISTLVLYAAKRFQLNASELGELMSALGLCTMIAEAVLVRILVPLFGEVKAIRLGLISFCVQCIILGLALEPWHLFLCALFSLLGNLVYPSLSSMVSTNVAPAKVGQALGALNGIKSLTEGIGPLVFGTLMTISEHSAVPGWPYLLAAVFCFAAYQSTLALPEESDDEDYVHEVELAKHYKATRETNSALFRQWMMSPTTQSNATTTTARQGQARPYTANDDDSEEYEGLLSEIEESEDDSVLVDRPSMDQLPTTFASFMKQQQQPPISLLKQQQQQQLP